MFNNPLKKYQQGGKTDEQQQMLAAFVEWLPKRVKEFEGMQPEQIVEALNGMSRTPEGQKQVQSLMEAFKQDIQQNAGMFKEGGKLHDFICKHARGGHMADCGCKENGGTVEKAQKGTPNGLGNGESRTITARDTTDHYHLPNGYAIKSVHPTDGSAPRYQVSNGLDIIAPTYTENPALENAVGIFARPFQWIGLAAERITPEQKAEFEAARTRTFGTSKEQEGGTVKKAQEGETITRSSTFPGIWDGVVPGIRHNDIPFNGSISSDISTPTTEAKTKTTGSIASRKDRPDYDSMSFSKAFAAARKSGAKVFTWRGKQYGTQTKEEAAASRPQTPALPELEVPEIQEPEVIISEEVPSIATSTPSVWPMILVDPITQQRLQGQPSAFAKDTGAWSTMSWRNADVERRLPTAIRRPTVATTISNWLNNWRKTWGL